MGDGKEEGNSEHKSSLLHSVGRGQRPREELEHRFLFARMLGMP
jgi:hypothetical protein